MFGRAPDFTADPGARPEEKRIPGRQPEGVRNTPGFSGTTRSSRHDTDLPHDPGAAGARDCRALHWQAHPDEAPEARRGLAGIAGTGLLVRCGAVHPVAEQSSIYL
jgi:hypothetical protein